MLGVDADVAAADVDGGVGGGDAAGTDPSLVEEEVVVAGPTASGATLLLACRAQPEGTRDGAGSPAGGEAAAAVGVLPVVAAGAGVGIDGVQR